MPRDNPKPRSDLDVEARLPAGIKIGLALVILIFIAGAAGLIYLNISSQAAASQASATATAQANTLATADAATATANVTATALAQAHTRATATAIAQAKATATANALASFRVQSITISVRPASIAGMTCGTPVNVTYTATITIASGSPGGTVALTWSIGSTSTPAHVAFAAGETVKTASITDMGTLARNNSYPRNGSIASTSPNVASSTTVRPAGTCV